MPKKKKEKAWTTKINAHLRGSDMVWSVQITFA